MSMMILMPMMTAALMTCVVSAAAIVAMGRFGGVVRVGRGKY